ncbi:hypothetical protein SAY87_002126 [Trapa incisa]|uniref:Cyanobacterial aminoacyl-tRNA synthetase CAAD domain-containing protein n=1 Tax=Trapa incisa TaxID=236973 RepID=A0AAN7PTJ3_9MYRT|nr:hypothetical protein SAY87_002126 [Trapa incisa]
MSAVDYRPHLPRVQGWLLCLPASPRLFFLTKHRPFTEGQELQHFLQFLAFKWDNSEDRLALIGLGFAGVVAFWASANLITAIDKLPLIPGVLEIIGILFSAWFTYQYLLFKPGREELIIAINKSFSNILGSYLHVCCPWEDRIVIQNQLFAFIFSLPFTLC